MTRKGLVALSMKTKNMFQKIQKSPKTSILNFRILMLLPGGGVSNIVQKDKKH